MTGPEEPVLSPLGLHLAPDAVNMMTEWRIHGMAAGLVILTGMLGSLLRMAEGEWRNWWRWLHIQPTGRWPLAAWLAATGFSFSALTLAPLPLTIAGLILGLWMWRVLDQTVAMHLSEEERRLTTEMSHWNARGAAERFKVEQDARRRQELADIQSAALRHLMDPHFLFNALNGVLLDLLQGNRESAISNLSAFRRLAIRQLHGSKGGWWSLREEWSVLFDYIQLEMKRIQRPVQLTFVPLPAHLLDVEVPSLMVQPLVENAIWHGLGGTGNATQGELSVEAALWGKNHVRILVHNSSPAVHGSQKKDPQHRLPKRRRHATDLIQQRLQLLRGEHRSKLSIEECGGMTKATLIMPFRQPVDKP